MAPDPFRPKEQRAYLHGYDVEIHAHPDSGWTFEVWEVDHSRKVAKGAADSEQTVKFLAKRTAEECAFVRDGTPEKVQILRSLTEDLNERLHRTLDELAADAADKGGHDDR